MNKRITFKEISDITKGQSFELELCESMGRLKLKKQASPLSIAPKEFNYIRDCITNNNLKYGYEVATAFGISSTAAGLAMKETKGICVTMDAYIEEHYNNGTSYSGKTEIYKDSEGYKCANYLIDSLDIKDSLFTEVGFSPTDTDKVLKKYNLNSLDYIFIDALHTDEAIEQDLLSIVKYININKCLILIHDTHHFDNIKLKNYIEKIIPMGKFNLVEGLEHPNGFYMSKICIGSIYA